MKIKEVIDALERFAPLPLQESYDNAGLQCGITKAEVSGALLCLDVTEEVLREAVDLDCNLVIAHHPLLFRGIKRVCDYTQVERCLRMAIQNDITVYAAHTNLDNAEDGVNYKMAEKLGLVDVVPMEGGGVIGYLTVSEDSLAFLQRVKDVFHVEMLQHNELLSRPIQSVALCGGAGAFQLDTAIAQEADAFLTGEMGYHLFFGHEQQIQIAVLGHYQSERFTTEIFQQLLEQSFPELPVFIALTETNPIHYL